MPGPLLYAVPWKLWAPSLVFTEPGGFIESVCNDKPFIIRFYHLAWNDLSWYHHVMKSFLNRIFFLGFLI